MLKYIGQYRIVYEIDKRTGKPLEFTYIPCRIKKGANICRNDGKTLNVYIPGIKLINKLLNEYPAIFSPYLIGDGEGSLLFDEVKFPEAAGLLKPVVKGKGVSPKSKRNIRYAEKQGVMTRKTGQIPLV